MMVRALNSSGVFTGGVQRLDHRELSLVCIEDLPWMAAAWTAREKSYGALKVEHFGKEWHVLNRGVSLCAFASRHFARTYRKALRRACMDVLYLLQFFRVDLRAEVVQ